MNPPGLKFRIFQKCMDAFRSNDLDAVERLLADSELSEREPEAIALANKLRGIVAQRKQSVFNTPLVLGEALQKHASDHFLLSYRDATPPLPGLSLVAGCMNRQENLLKVLPSWLATSADEILIVDWSSTFELWPIISQINDPRLKLVRIDGEENWIAAHALNVAFRFATHELVFRVDCDINLAPKFLETNVCRRGEFVRGFWKAGLECGGEGQQFIHGTFGAWKSDLKAANYYDERIMSYGWEDSDMYLRLSHDLGLAGKLIDPTSLKHIEQSEQQRLANQSVPKNRFLGRFEPTEFEGAKNKYYTTIAGTWANYFPLQDYEFSGIGERYFRGHRLTTLPMHNAGYLQLAEILATLQLTIWASSEMPELAGLEQYSMDLAKLLRVAHSANKSRNFLDGLKTGKGLYFIRCEEGECRSSLSKSLSVMRAHHPELSAGLILIEGSTESFTEVPTMSDGTVLVTSGDLIDMLTARIKPQELDGIWDLEDLLDSGRPDSAHLSISTRSLAAESIRRAARFADRLGGDFETVSAPVKSSCLVTSLYDERNLLRLVEYVACVVENLRVFSQVVILYEAGGGLLMSVLHIVADAMGISPGRLLILPFQKRPTFEDLFSIKTFLPAGTIIAAANADVVFDASFARIGHVDLSGKMIVLSRRDVSRDGTVATLIRLENGSPNTFSADAWIVKTPFDHDFFLDYPIGTMHCDSFINHQLSVSRKYRALNPCFDVRVFHLHDERFNSSAEKQRRDFDIIRKSYNLERARNDNADPVKGVAWSTLSTALMIPEVLQFQQWRPISLVINFGEGANIGFAHLLLLHVLCETAQLMSDVVVVVKLKRRDLESSLGLLLARYQTYYSRHSLLLDIDHGVFDPVKAAAEGTVVRSISFNTAADWIIRGSLNYQHGNTRVLLAWPTTAGVKLLRCEVSGELSYESKVNLIRAFKEQGQEFVKSLMKFYDRLPDYSGEKNLITPFIIPNFLPGPPRLGGGKSPAVSFVTSLYNGGMFLPGYLENVLAAAVESSGEVIIIDANADNRDMATVENFIRSNPVAKHYIEYIRLDHDPGLYECWRIGIERARADLISNANIDDRRCPYHTARLVERLKQQPSFAGACGSISCVTGEGTGDWFTLYENQLWFFHEGITEITFENLYRADEQGEIRSRDVMHCMPVWRKSLHERYGYFDETTYGTSADWAFWLKCTKAGERFLFDDGAFGRYFLNPDSHNRRNDPDGRKELQIIKDFIGVTQAKVHKQ
ncbi:MAG: glycosyltransferase [Candidatus Accumulibacter propinquus]|jgi:glycosyltransferase involved in cell wall biosynthesis